MAAEQSRDAAEKDWAGVLRLDIAGEAGTSRATRQYHEGALRVLRPHYLDRTGHVAYTVINPGGAYFGADNYLLDLTVRAGASATLTTQSATKVYKTPQGPAFQRMNVVVEEGGYCEYVPDQLIVYENGDYIQRTDATLHTGASLVMSEIVTPGWSPRGEHFTYAGLSMRAEVRVTDGENTRRLALDHLRVRPAEEADVNAAGLMEGHTHTGQLLLASSVITDEFVDAAQKILDDCGYTVGLSVLGGERSLGMRGLAVRSLAQSTAEIAAVHTRIITMFRDRAAGLGPLELRKY